MNLLPYEHFSIHTNLDRDEVLRRLSGAIASEFAGMRIPYAYRRPFYGTMTANGFQAAPTPFDISDVYRPRVSGQITADAGQTTLDVTITANSTATLIAGGVLGLSALGLLTLIAQSISAWVGGQYPDPLILIWGLLTLLAIIAVTLILFIVLMKIHARRAERFFTRLLAGDPPAAG